jgi:hypothetical protein
MGKQQPTIDLAGYQRLAHLERQVWYSPLNVTVYLICLAPAAIGIWNLKHDHVAILGILCGHAMFILCYFVLSAYFYSYCFGRLKCPGCDQLMQPFVAELEEGTWWGFNLRAFEFGGRFYHRSYHKLGRGPWMRLMRTVRACPCCHTFVDCSHLHEEPCTLDELTQLYRGYPAA